MPSGGLLERTDCNYNRSKCGQGFHKGFSPQTNETLLVNVARCLADIMINNMSISTLIHKLPLFMVPLYINNHVTKFNHTTPQYSTGTPNTNLAVTILSGIGIGLKGIFFTTSIIFCIVLEVKLLYDIFSMWNRFFLFGKP